MAEAFAAEPLSRVDRVAFGDLFLEDYDERLLAELPPGVDPCGENGEFHTFVHAGPIFGEPIVCKPGEIVERDGFAFCDLTPA